MSKNFFFLFLSEKRHYLAKSFIPRVYCGKKKFFDLKCGENIHIDFICLKIIKNKRNSKMSIYDAENYCNKQNYTSTDISSLNAKVVLSYIVNIYFKSIRKNPTIASLFWGEIIS